MKVPFLDLQAHHEPIRPQLDEAIHQVIESGAFAGGPFVDRFERDFAAFCETSHAIGVGSGTEALWLALLALGIGPGDEVITVPNSFMATAEAISYCGALPVFVDVDECTYTMNPGALQEAITPRTKAVIPVHLFGQPADMDPILELGREYGIHVVEDACQAHGARYKGRRTGSMGVAGCFSFYPGKNLGAFGEAGAVTTNNPGLAEKIRILRDHGQSRKYHHAKVGWNCRMDGIQAAVLQVKLPSLERDNQRRRDIAVRYNEALRGVPGVLTPLNAAYARHVYHIYAVRVKERERVMERLAQQEVGCAVHYPIAIHLQEAYRGLGYEKGSFPVAERCAREFVSLPMYPELTPTQVERVVASLADAVANNS